MKGNQQRVRSLLAEAITILCKNTLSYDSEFCIEGLLGITLDKNEVFLVNINENVHGKGSAGPSGGAATVVPSQLNVIQQHVAPPPVHVHPVPTSRPIPAKSPFMPRRPTFGQRARWKTRGKYLHRPPSRLPGRSSPTTRPASEVLPTSVAQGGPELIEVTDAELQQDLASSVSMVTDNGNNAGNTTADSQTADLLSSLDFSDMVSQDKDNSSSQPTADSDDTIPRDEEANNDAPTGNDEDTFDSDAIIIKPDPEDQQDVLQTSCSSDSGMMYATSIDHTGGMLPPNPSEHAIMSSAMTMPMGSPAAYMSPAIPGFSGWSPTVSIGGTSSLATPGRSGPGRPIAPASSQGSQSQNAKWTCQLCGKEFLWKGDCARHIRATHTQDEIYSCEECDYVANRAFNLRRHMKSRHQLMTKNVD